MKLIIDIDNEIQNKISVMGLDRLTPDDIRTVSKAISHGTPLDDIKAEIREETECHYGDKCLGANCPSNTDCMIMGEHAIGIIDKHISGKENG